MIELDLYEQIPIAYWVEARLLPDMTEVPVERYRKDYDEYPDSRPTSYPQQFDTTHWMTILGIHEAKRVGGAIVAYKCQDFDMLEGREDLAILVDLRVSPKSWGRGVGKRLFHRACDWARDQGCTELRVETQDTNVPACRFYRAMGCSLLSWDEGAYGPELNEAKLVWSRALG